MTATRGAEQRQGGLWGSPRWDRKWTRQGRQPRINLELSSPPSTETSSFYEP